MDSQLGHVHVYGNYSVDTSTVRDQELYLPLTFGLIFGTGQGLFGCNKLPPFRYNIICTRVLPYLTFYRSFKHPFCTLKLSFGTRTGPRWRHLGPSQVSRSGEPRELSPLNSFVPTLIVTFSD